MSACPSYRSDSGIITLEGGKTVKEEDVTISKLPRTIRVRHPGVIKRSILGMAIGGVLQQARVEALQERQHLAREEERLAIEAMASLPEVRPTAQLAGVMY